MASGGECRPRKPAQPLSQQAGQGQRSPPLPAQQQAQQQRQERWQRRQQRQQGDVAAQPPAATFPLADLPAELLLAVAVRLPTAADAQHLLCRTSRAVRERVEGHLVALPVTWLLHNHPTTALTRAARRGDVPLLSALLTAAGERPDKDEALAAAASQQCCMAALEVLLAAGAVPQAGLAAAAGAGVREAVRALMAVGADPFADGAAAVRAGCDGRHAAGVLRDILGFKSKWFVYYDGQRLTQFLRILCDPFVAAARAGDWVAADALLRGGHMDRGVQYPDCTDPVALNELIAWAAAAAGDAGHADVALRLVAAVQSEWGQGEVYRQALVSAACRGRVAAMRRLLEMRPPSDRCLDGALEVACKSGSIEAVHVLLAAGAEVDCGALYAAAEPDEGEAVAMLRVLWESGATDPRLLNYALDGACCVGSVLIAGALLEACRGRVALNLEAALTNTVKADHAEDGTQIVQALLEAGARVEALGHGELQGYAGRPDRPTRRVLQAAGVDFGGVDAAAAAAAAKGAEGRGQQRAR